MLRQIIRSAIRGRTLSSMHSLVARHCGWRRRLWRPRQVFSIGMYTGQSVGRLGPHPGASNPVMAACMVTDMDAAFVADPFMIAQCGYWWMFFEAWNKQTGRGEIACARSKDALKWSYVGRVLREPFHLSYPHIIADEGIVWMLPETGRDNVVRLYRAEEFPLKWSRGDVLLRGGFCDATPFKVEEIWWMLVAPYHRKANDELRLLWANRLQGPWREHPQSPIVSNNPMCARPAGRVLVDNGSVVRFAQACRPFYGSSVYGYYITKLSPTEYYERPVAQEPVLGGAGCGWNAHGMHHIDAVRLETGGWLACVDGWVGCEGVDWGGNFHA